MQRLLDFIFPPREDELIVREIQPDTFVQKVSPCIVDYTRPGAVSLLPFHDKHVRAAIHETKYHNNKQAKRVLASALDAYLSDMDERYKNIHIVPIPLGELRMKKRGYNQIEEVLASINKSTTDSFVIDSALLKRTRETESQVSLHREKRRENMRGAFTATRQVDPAYLYIVVDDVITTGATLQAAIDALESAGAEHVVPLALAH